MLDKEPFLIDLLKQIYKHAAFVECSHIPINKGFSPKTVYYLYITVTFYNIIKRNK